MPIRSCKSSHIGKSYGKFTNFSECDLVLVNEISFTKILSAKILCYTVYRNLGNFHVKNIYVINFRID